MPRLRIILKIWALMALVLGVVASNIPWGDPEGFHGTGFPFAGVYWDYIDDTASPRDFPNPIAPILNALAFFTAGSVAIVIVYGFHYGMRKFASSRRAMQPSKATAEHAGAGGLNVAQRKVGSKPGDHAK